MANRIVIDTGLESYEIADASDKVLGVISFNPRDLNFYGRARRIHGDIVSLVREAQQVAKDAESEADATFIETIDRIDKQIRAKLDELAGCNISEVAFGAVHCMSLGSNGRSLCLNLLEGIAGLVEQRFAEQAEKSRAVMNEYTEGYDETVREAPSEATD